METECKPTYHTRIFPSLFFLLAVFFLTGCSGGNENKEASAPPAQPEETTPEATADPVVNKGVGPITSVNLGELDTEMAAEGKELYESLCTACHKLDQRYIGPSLADVTERRSPEWIMNMILNPTEMVKEDPEAKKLLAEYISPMADQNLSEEQARKILEYFRSISQNQ